jgi:hypothetical protein
MDRGIAPQGLENKGDLAMFGLAFACARQAEPRATAELNGTEHIFAPIQLEIVNRSLLLFNGSWHRPARA